MEAGLVGTLTLAGVTPGDAVLATLTYRLVSYWLPIRRAPSHTARSAAATRRPTGRPDSPQRRVLRSVPGIRHSRPARCLEGRARAGARLPEAARAACRPAAPGEQGGADGEDRRRALGRRAASDGGDDRPGVRLAAAQGARSGGDRDAADRVRAACRAGRARSERFEALLDEGRRLFVGGAAAKRGRCCARRSLSGGAGRSRSRALRIRGQRDSPARRAAPGRARAAPARPSLRSAATSKRSVSWKRWFVSIRCGKRFAGC